MLRVVVATHNSKKLVELERLAEGRLQAVQWLSLGDFPAYPEPRESGMTFEENAIIKARAAAHETGCVAIADDSGLEVDLLNGMPGLLSARWSGADATDESNLRLVLDQIADFPDEQRTARFVCALALVSPDGRVHVERKTFEGMLVREPVGENGFGYDPIFQPTGETRTSAQLSAEEKDAISHRGKAVRALIDYLAGLESKGLLRQVETGVPDGCCTPEEHCCCREQER